ncbi:MAG TPA: hypothetical protein VKU44_06275, partial [Terriglobia bacterium]|nr:hypothetical protein [Terriglobia bacterium]
MLHQLQCDIEGFVRTLEHPVLLEDGAGLCDLTLNEWRFLIDHGRLILEVWHSERSLVRRVERVLTCDAARMSLAARRQNGCVAVRLEILGQGGLESYRPAPSAAERHEFSRQLVRMLGRDFPGCRIERVSHRSHRQHSLSAWYARGVAQRNQSGWAFLGLSEAEGIGARDSALAFGLVWLDWLRGRRDGERIRGLKLFLPRPAVEAAAHRAAFLDPRTTTVEIFEWSPPRAWGAAPRAPEGVSPRKVDLADYGNVQTGLVPRRERDAVVGRHRGLLRELL